MSGFFQRAILAPRNDAVESINIKLLRQLSVPEHTYKSFDKVCDGADFTKFPLEFLNSLQPPGVPPHNLILKVGAPIMMLRNIRPPQLVNGTRMSVKACRQSSKLSFYPELTKVKLSTYLEYQSSPMIAQLDLLARSFLSDLHLLCQSISHRGRL